jgi:hypothetical protein
MPIQGLLKAEGAVFGPEDIKAITAAFEETLKRLNVFDRNAAMAMLVAQTTIQLAKEGERDPRRLTEKVVRFYRVNPIPS